MSTHPASLYQDIWHLYQHCEQRRGRDTSASVTQVLADIQQASILFRILLDLRHQILSEQLFED